MTEEISDQELVDRMREGERSAVDVLYRRYHGQALRYARSIAQDEATAEDFAAEAFLKMWEAVLAGRTPERPRSYLLRVVHNLHIDLCRKRARLTRDANPEETIDRHPAHQVSDFSDRLLDRSALDAALTHLKPRQREALWSTVVLGYSTSEVASRFEMTSANAGAQLACRAKASLRTAYAAATA